MAEWSIRVEFGLADNRGFFYFAILYLIGGIPQRTQSRVDKIVAL